MDSLKKVGDIGESFVANWLRMQKFKILEQNYATRFGEIDIIAQKGEVLAFVEVKTRKIKHFPISNVVTISKQRKIINTAKIYMCKKYIFDYVCRFDVASVVINDQKQEIEYISDAFREY